MINTDEYLSADKDQDVNINVRELFSGKEKPTINYFLEKNLNKEYSIRNFCIHNNELDIDESDEGYIAQGKCGVVRKGRVISPDGSHEDLIFKIFISHKVHPVELEEIKYTVELNKLLPDCVIKIKFIERCNILESSNNNVSMWSDNKEIILLGMEQGISTLDSYLLSVEHDIDEFERVLSLALDTCDKINRSGYFHRDIKPVNIVIVNRNGINVPVLIDFGAMCYMSNIDKKYNLSDKNPPLDSFYLALHMLYTFEPVKSVRPICLYFAFKFYKILMFYLYDDINIKNINDHFFNHYFNTPPGSDYFGNVFLKYFKKFGEPIDFIPIEDITRYIHNRVKTTIEKSLDSVEIKNYNNSSSLFDIIKTEIKHLNQLDVKTPCTTATHYLDFNLLCSFVNNTCPSLSPIDNK